MNEFARRAAEGPAPWGRILAWPASPGLWERTRLTIYPPGTSSVDRRSLQFTHTWPVVGVIVGFAEMGALGHLFPVMGATLAALSYLAGLWFGLHFSRDLRRRTRTMTVAKVFIAGEMVEFGDVHRLEQIRSRLADLESRRLSRRIDPALYEAEWAEIFYSLPFEDPAHVSNR
ncbi:DUF6611 family protein [Subtercola lobariae]|uniref:DUF6611 family protein n=1 Tax=Subtercola lobariae TaxID=1588641 RepID=UPI0027E54A65|nr:DUF6611 family protein [Subtercola lobariae]